ncbi:hypothetical protein [Sorangium sp. So ce1153]|uniref:hypothetical protein n=1 Tax=Sorangium sp. So ce1153 TaxID=3133333 RepID=UPI003F5F3551
MSKRPSAPVPRRPRGWLSLKTAAGYLDMPPDALQRALECRAVRTADGDIEANIGGIRAGKLGPFMSNPSSERWLATEGI